MARTHQRSDVLELKDTPRRKKRLRIVYKTAKFRFIQRDRSGDTGSTIELVDLPRGKIKIVSARLNFKSFEDLCFLSLGHSSYITTGGEKVEENLEAFLGELDVNKLTRLRIYTCPIALDKLIDSEGDFVLKAKIFEGAIQVGDVISGHIRYTEVGTESDPE